MYGSEDISRVLEAISPKYKTLWDGILFALNDRNPARVKQVGYSARDLIQTYVDEFAPEDLVRSALGKVKITRRERIAYVLSSDSREQLVWVLDHLDALFASLESTMSTIGYDRLAKPADEVNMRALTGLVGNAIVLLESNRRR